MKPIDPLQLQRLIDGELDEMQVQQILSDAKTMPDQWQNIAVGFVENQIWDRAFQDGSDRKLELAKTESFARSAVVAKPKEHNANDAWPGSNYSWLVLAASLLVAGTIGYMGSQIQNRRVPSSSVAENQAKSLSDSLIVDRSPAVEQLAQPRMTPANYHLEVPADNQHLGDLVSAGPVPPVPLYSVGSAEELRQLAQQRTTPALPPEMLKQLAGSGYQMEQKVDFISGRLGDGRSFFVPVRTIRFVPGQ